MQFMGLVCGWFPLAFALWRQRCRKVAVARGLIEILQHKGVSDYSGEPISQLEHALQTCDLAAKNPQFDHNLVVAALLHDIGHLIVHPSLTKWGQPLHAQAGANWLHNQGFSAHVCDLVRHHVAAKRFQCTVSPRYLSRLSLASQNTMVLQGGLMDDEEVKHFSCLPNCDQILQLREYDDQAKDPNLHLAYQWSSWQRDCLRYMVRTLQ